MVFAATAADGGDDASDLARNAERLRATLNLVKIVPMHKGFRYKSRWAH